MRDASETYRPIDMMEAVNNDSVKLRLGIFAGNLYDFNRRMVTLSANGVF